jgi:hypothetical protein
MTINVTSSLVDNHAMPMCSVAASGSPAASDLGRTAIWFNKSFAGISGVCSVAGRVGVDRFLELRPWFGNLFLMKLIARNAARKDVYKPKELTSTNDTKQILFRLCSTSDRLWGYFVYEGSELISSKRFFLKLTIGVSLWVYD